MQLDTTAIPLGGQTRLVLSLRLPMPPSETVRWPSYADTLTSQLEIIRTLPIDTVPNDGRYELHQAYIITSFDTGYIVIPPLSVGVGNEEFESNPLLLQVVAPLLEQELRDVKDMQEVEYGLLDKLVEYRWVILALATSLLLLIWLVRRWRMRPEPAAKETIAETKPLPAYDEALKALEELESKQLWQKGHAKQYHSELTDVLRRYIERRYHVKTFERTTRQILTDLRLTGANGDAYDRLKATLQLADVVKFAKFKPEPEEHNGALSNARFFLEQTRQTEAING